MFSDLFIMSSFGLIQPIFAIFMIKQIGGATTTAVGVAVAIQLFTKSILQIMVAKWADDEKGNCRELYTLIVGSIIVSIVPLGYVLATSIAHIYLIQFLYGVGQALSFPSWRVIFTSYVSGDKAGYEWGTYDTVVSLGTAAAATLGGYFADTFSFRYLFAFVSVMSFFGTAFLTRIFQQEFRCKIHFKI